MSKDPKARKLGKGLGALLPPRAAGVESAPAEAGAQGGRARNVPTDSIRRNPHQPRDHFDEQRLRELAGSIRSQGVLQPLVVREVDEGYELIAGERRLRASRLAGLSEVPVVIADVLDENLLELALVENLQREDLNILEIAAAFRQLCEDLGLTHEQVAQRVGISRAQVSNTLRLLKLPSGIQSLVMEGSLSAGHARVLLSLPGEAEMTRLAQRIQREGLSVRETERLVREMEETPKSGGRGTPRTAAPKDPVIADLEDQLRQHFGTKVEIQQRDGKGEVRIEFYSHADFERILGIIGLETE